MVFLPEPALVSTSTRLFGPRRSKKQVSFDFEMRKLNFLQDIEAKIKKETQQSAIDKGCNPSEKSPVKRRVLSVFYYFMVTFGLLQYISGSYLFAMALFSLIPKISNPLVIVLSMLFTVLDSILFYALEISYLKDALGITSEHGKNTESLINIYSKQLNVTCSINQLLTSTDSLTISQASYNEYIKFAELFNQDMKMKQKNLENYHETIWKKLLKWGVLCFGFLSSIAGSYFWASSFIEVVAISLMGTPIGWCFIILTTIAQLGFFYTMSSKSMVELVHPELAKFELYKEALEQFQAKDRHDFEKIASMQRRMKKAETREFATQTERNSEHFVEVAIEETVCEERVDVSGGGALSMGVDVSQRREGEPYQKRFFSARVLESQPNDNGHRLSLTD